MYTKISNTTKYVGGNTGSCAKLVNYLEKENNGVDLGSREMFFSLDKDNIDRMEVLNKIDNNKQKLTKQEDKFYMISVNPSQAELKHLAKLSSSDNRNITSPSQLNSKEYIKYNELLKNYTREVMDEYAKNFYGRNIEGKDLMYYAKLEHKRKYSRDDKFVKNNKKILAQMNQSKTPEDLEKMINGLHIDKYTGKLIAEGDLKGGFQEHIHIVVSRKSLDGQKKLSPLSNSRGGKIKLNGKKVNVGFNRVQFYKKVQDSFDKKFRYNREIKQSFEYRNFKKNGLSYIYNAEAKGKLKKAHIRRLNNMAKQVVVKPVIEEAKNEEMKIALQKAKTVRKVIKIASSVTNPKMLAINLVKEGMKKVIRL